MQRKLKIQVEGENQAAAYYVPHTEITVVRDPGRRELCVAFVSAPHIC